MPPVRGNVGPGDWTVGAVRKLEALGLVEQGYDAGWRTPERGTLEVVLRNAIAMRDTLPPAVARLVDGYWRRYRVEYDIPLERRPAMSRSDLWAGVAGGVGRVTVGSGYESDDWTPPPAIPDGMQSLVAWTGEGSVAGGTAVAWEVDVRGNEVQVPRAFASVALGSIEAWLGRRTVGYGAARTGSLVLEDEVAFDGLGLANRAPVPFPGILRFLGFANAETFLARLDRNAPYRHPWFWAMRLSVHPHERLTVAASRGVIFGGEGNAPFTLRNFLYLVVGDHGGAGGEFEKNTVSLDVRYRPPLPIPTAAYLEWGFTDNAGAIVDNAAQVVGLEFPALPGVPGVGVGAEFARIPARCCGHGMWYRHWSFRDGWSVDGQALGHPLAGEGKQWALFGDAHLLDGRLMLEAEGFRRWRGVENMLGPTREGWSSGGQVRLAWTSPPGILVEGQWGTELGVDWDEVTFQARLGFAFGGGGQ